MKYERKLIVYGDVHEDCILKVTLDRFVIKHGLVKAGKNVEIYSFDDDVQRHGKLPVSLELETGSLTFTKVRSMYPAIIRSDDELVLGNVLFDQPISNPLYTFDDGVRPVDYRIDSDLQYNHIFFNGPSYWQVDVDEVDERVIDIGRIHEEEAGGGVKLDDIPPYVQPVFLYVNEDFQYNELIEQIYG
jgi:hypothetical protein